MNELEYRPEMAGYRYTVPDVKAGDVILVPRDQCDDLVLEKGICRVFGGTNPYADEGKAGAASAA